MRRRTFLKGVGTTLGASAIGLAGASRARAQAKEVVYASTGGTWQEAARKAWLEPFAKETGIRVIDVFPAETGKLAAMVQAGNVEWDAMDIAGASIGAAVDKGLLEKLDWSIISRDGLDPASYNDYAAPYGTYATIMIYNTKRYPDPAKAPASWADFWNVEKFPGPRSLRNRPHVMLESALLADGVPVDKLYPLDLDRAFRKMDQIKPHVKVWWTSGAQSIQLVTDGEVDIGVTWGGRALDAQKAGAPVAIVWNQSALAQLFHVVPKGAKNKEAGMRLINYIMTPRNWVRILETYQTSVPSNAKMLDMAEVKRILPDAAERRKRQYVLDELGYWAKNFDAVNTRYTQWITRA